MAVFSTNQVRQFYVAKELKTPHVLPADAAGSISVNTDKEKKNLYFEYKGADSTMRSDLIKIDSIVYGKATAAAALSVPLKKAVIKLNEKVNGGDPVVGEDYIVKIMVSQFVGMSDEDIYYKFGAARAFAGMSASDLMIELAISLAKNFSRESSKLFKFAVAAGATETEVTPQTKKEDLTGTYDSLVITELEQGWELGKVTKLPVIFNVFGTPITWEKVEMDWADITIENSTEVIKNGTKIADLEYFCMGERADQYRGMGYPYDRKTTYLVDPTKEYNVLDIHFYYEGGHENPQKSEKDITIVAEDAAVLDNIIKAINTAAGTTIETLA